jgi:hypothetical protein
MARGLALRFPLASAFALGLLSACPGGADDDSSSDDDVGSDDGAGPSDGCPEGLPPPADPCLAGCGNEIGVGQPCTEDGGECFHWFQDGGADYAWLCTADASDTSMTFCTKPCVLDADCGSAAICTGDPEHPDSGRGCFPLACWNGPPPWDAEWVENHATAE